MPYSEWQETMPQAAIDDDDTGISSAFETLAGTRLRSPLVFAEAAAGFSGGGGGGGGRGWAHGNEPRRRTVVWSADTGAVNGAPGLSTVRRQPRDLERHTSEH